MFDGISGGGFVCPKGSKIERIRSCYYTSDTTARDFGFSAISFTGLSSPAYVHCHLRFVIQTMMCISIRLYPILGRSSWISGPVT